MKKSITAMTLVSVLLGAMIGMQFKSVKQQNQSLSLQRANELSAEVRKLQTERDELQNKVAELESSGGQAEQSLVKELQDTRNLAGLSTLSGEGVIVTLHDSSTKDKKNANPNVYLIHDEDILSAVNELFAAGAEAISINGQRLVSNSSVRCVGPVVTINSVKLAAPYEIHAIGKPEVLEGALKMPNGVIDSLSPWGIEIDVKRSNKVVVPQYDGAMQFQFAQPVTEGRNS